MKLAAFAVALLLLVPSVAAAAERRLVPGGVFAMTADGGWISYADGEGLRAGRGDTFRRLPTRGDGFNLGTDSRGRAVGLYTVCRRQWCNLRERQMASGRVRVVIRYRRRPGFIGADRARGVLVLARIRRGRNAQTTIEVRRRGQRRVRRVVPGLLQGFEAERGHVLVSATRGDQLTVRDLIPGRRGLSSRTIAVDSQFDDDCRCTSSAARVHGLSADGRYAYWIEEHFQTRGGEPLGGGYPTDVTTRVVRADLTARPQRNAAVDLPRRSLELAVDRGRVLYTPFEGPSALYEWTDPAWRPIGTGRRTVGPIPPTE